MTDFDRSKKGCQHCIMHSVSNLSLVSILLRWSCQNWVLNYNLLGGAHPNIMVSEISLTYPYAMDLFYSYESINPYILLFL